MAGLGANVETRNSKLSRSKFAVVRRFLYSFGVNPTANAPNLELLKLEVFAASLRHRVQRLPAIEHHGEFLFESLQTLTSLRDRGTVLLVEARRGHRLVQ